MLPKEDIMEVVEGLHGDPFSVLGPHIVGEGGGKNLEVRAFLPEAAEAWVVYEKGLKVHAFEKVHEKGFFAVRLPVGETVPYLIRIKTYDGQIVEFRDPYAFGQILTDYDLYLMAEGSHYLKYEKLGSHITEIGGVAGVHFAVWAPNAKRVSVIGDFNRWDGRRHPMRLLVDSGIWEIFVPDIGEGELYKFDIRSRYHNYRQVKADPYGFYFEMRPKSASIVHDINHYRWNDELWLKKRGHKNWFESPMVIYEVHLGSWMRVHEEGDRVLTYRELADKLVIYAKSMGYTHIELLPVSEHPFDASWGYQTIGYFAPTSRFGTPEDLMFFVDRCHENDIGVILDWVPAHFPKDGHGLAFFDGTSLYEHFDKRQGEHRDWGTLIFNYGRKEVMNFLISNALFWIEKYHIDGLRVDAVASMIYLDYSRKPGEWIPNKYGGNENLEAIAFIKKFNEITHEYFPGILTIAEESTAWPAVSRPVYLGGLGFDMKWNMGWMNDMLVYISKDPVHRKYHHNNLTFGLVYAFSENFVLVISHDEVVHGKRSMLSKMPGDVWRKFASLRLLYGFMYGHPGKKLLFMGDEFGQWDEWKFDGSLDWQLLDREEHRGLQKYVRDLNALYVSEPALHEVDFAPAGFEWIDFRDTENSVVSFIRRAEDRDDYVVVVCNFTPVPRKGYRIGVPEKCFYREILNSDSQVYWGSNVGNMGGVVSDPVPWHGKACSMKIVMPPLAIAIFKPER
ncbi:MAG: 1,4-alpha-glucan branching protein GlgB [Nitrospiraceae bacterium]|nr:1,4-alpha-glucan branching protein GlgB [Nitrospiraceae bacterium]